MPFMSIFLPGFGAFTADTVTTTGAITSGGRVTGTGFTASSDGTAGTPAYNYTNDAGLGWYRSANDQMTYAANGVGYARFQPVEIETGSANLTVNSVFDTRGNVISLSPRSANIVAVGTTVSQNGNSIVELTVAAGGIVSTAAPFIVDGSAGQEIILINVDAADALTLANDGGTATNLRLRAATRVLAANGGYLTLRFSTTTGLWHEVSFG